MIKYFLNKYQYILHKIFISISGLYIQTIIIIIAIILLSYIVLYTDYVSSYIKVRVLYFNNSLFLLAKLMC